VKLRNELHNVRVSDAGGRSIEGIVRVRRLNLGPARLGRHEPIAVVVQTRSGVQRVALPRRDRLPGIAAALAGPALFLAAKRFFRKGRRR